MKTALICGITGQDGAYLARYLLLKGYEVWGTSRDSQVPPRNNLDALGIFPMVKLQSMVPNDFRSVLQCITSIAPDEIYNLSGQTSVALSFEQPRDALESITVANLNFLEAIRFTGRPIRFFNAGSSEIFGNCASGPANESSPLDPQSPYAIAKSSAYWQTKNYREAYGLYACTGILFNHESPLRPARFVTQKVILGACRIAAGSDEPLSLGNIKIMRDWGWAPEYVEAIWKMLQLDEPANFVVATGQKHTLQEFIATAFECCGLDWRDHVTFDERLLRPSEVNVNYGDPSKAAKELGWKATSGMKEVIQEMVSAVRIRLGTA